MKYRKFGPLDWEVSALGFGAMRLPIVDGDSSNIDEPHAIKMIRYAIDHGVNYVDTAYPYHQGESEYLVGKALKDGYREKVKLATKMPTWLVEEYTDFDKYLDEQLDKLDTEYIDFYLLHGLRSNRWPKIKELGVFEWAEKAKKDGRIKHLGFSFHDEYDVFEQILEYSEHFTFCQIQLNYMDIEYQAGLKGLKLAADKGLAVVIMEPIKGGKLAVTPPKDVQEVWAKAEKKRSPAEWALQWVWNHPEVSVVLSGMSEMKHVEENVEYADRSEPGSLTEKELALIQEAKEAYNNLGFIGCTACRYCMPCPQGVEIPAILGLYNEYYMSGQSDEIKEKYWEQITPETHSSNCISCGVCEEQCPQELPIRKFMSEATRMFKQSD
ncbi:4Fe-4S dicluster domain-containing protein [Candidatus Bathyarchaeota archaeon]|nr:4Fe-4S dicluster domain-containing protein [Candidatus Bathyarchaeota archaeon]